jgi:site-specific DNA-methyltransferase (adenine-specific)
VNKVVIGDCELYQGDCLDILPTLGKVDAVITDPPYGTQGSAGGYGRRQLHLSSGMRTIKNDEDLSMVKKMLPLLAHNNCYALIFHSGKKTKDFIFAIGDLEYTGSIVWDKKMMGLGYKVRYSHENIAVLKLGEGGKINYGIDSVLEFIEGDKLHPHQKPIALMNKLITWQNGSVIDPFMGSGTTGVACAQLGRKFIGIELDQKYFDIACKRIEQAYAQGQLFERDKPKAEQVSFEM